jgi:hypothetical protein
MYEILFDIYGNHLPKNLFEAVDFAISSRTRPFSIVERPIELSGTTSHAYTNGKTITITSNIFLEDYLESYEEDEKLLPLALVTLYNGYLLHESTHIFIDSARLAHKLKKFDNYLFQCLEDLYLENWIYRHYPSVGGIVQDCFQLVLKEPEYDSIYSVLMTLRSDLFFDEAMDKLTESQKTIISEIINNDLSVEDRYKIYCKFNLASSREEDNRNKSAISAQKTTMNHEQEKIRSSGELFKRGSSDLLEKANKQLELLNDADKEKDYSVNWTEPRNRFATEVVPDRSWKNLGSYLLRLKSRNEENSFLDKVGFDIDEEELYLCNVEENPRIFSKKGFVWDEKKPELAIAVDTSGSTNYRDLIGKLISSVAGIHNSLKKVRIKFAIIAHNAGHNSNIYPICNYGLKGKSKFNNSKLKGILQSLAGRGDNRNCDGTVIAECVKLFTKSPNKKIILMLTDGRPTVGTSSRSASSWLIYNIDKARNLGIEVYAIALTQEIVNQTENLYGKEFVIDASGNVQANLQKVIRRMIDGRK